MPFFVIRATDLHFQASDDGAEYLRPEAALASGVASAIALVAEEIAGGAQNAAVEVSVEEADGTKVLRSVVAVSVSSLSIAAPADPLA